MSKAKAQVIWLRFEVRDTAADLAAFRSAADRLFRRDCVMSWAEFSEAEVAQLAKSAFLAKTSYRYTPDLYCALVEAAYEHCHNCLALNLEREEDIPGSEELIESNCPLPNTQTCFCRRWWALLSLIQEADAEAAANYRRTPPEDAEDVIP